MINLKRVFNSHDRSPYTGVCTYVVIIASASLRLRGRNDSSIHFLRLLEY